MHEQRAHTPHERRKTEPVIRGIKAKIMEFFDQYPNAKISPSEFKTLLDLPNAIHSIRPRFTDLKQANKLIALDDNRIHSPFGGEERRHCLPKKPEQLKLL